MISTAGTIVRWNRAVAEIYGYPTAEALERPVDFLCFPGERTALLLPSPEAADGEIVERHRRRDGSQVFVSLRFEALEDGGLLVVVRDVTADREAHKRALVHHDALGASRREVRRLAGRLLGAQEGERQRIARELHDDGSRSSIQHTLTFTSAKSWRRGAMSEVPGGAGSSSPS